jgi:hypothetical protein
MAFQQYPQKFGIPSGDTAGRPSSPVIGDTYYNGEFEILEIYNGDDWVAASAPPSTPQLVSVTDVGTLDYSSGGTLTVLFSAGSGGGTPNQYNAFTIAGGFSASSSGTTVTLTGLTPATSFTVYGNAQNNFGTTINTPNAAAVTATTRPQAPTIGTASTSGVTTDVTITWTLGATGGKNLSAITITPYLNGTTAQTAATAATTSSTSHTFTGLTEGSSYTFKVKTTNANGDSPESSATNSVTIPAFISVDYLVVAGGGGGGYYRGGGGGAGGLRSTVTATGGDGALETALILVKSTNYTVTVGGGGTGSTTSGAGPGTQGVNSVFSTITSTGGGGGGSDTVAFNPTTGGSGGGGCGPNSSGAGTGAAGTANQGYGGGTGSDSAPNYGGAGGGGADAVGGNGSSTTGGNGGNGVATSITGSSVTRAGGGGGGVYIGGTNGTGGTGGGGNGGLHTTTAAVAGTENTGGGGGGGGGGASPTLAPGAAGGSGVVILRYLTADGTITIGAGLTGSTATDGSHKVTTITAGSGNVSWA